MQDKDGINARTAEIKELEDQFDEMLESIFNPWSEVDLSQNAFMQAGERELDKLKWDMGYYTTPQE